MKTLRMKSGSALILQVAIALVGISALGFMLWEPHVEGRNAHATIFQIYLRDPFLAYVYLGSIPFFMALTRAFRMFGHVRLKGTFSPVHLDALRAIKRYAMVFFGFVAGGVIIILIFGDPEDRPPGVFMSLLAAIAASAIATTAAVLARRLQSALMRADGRHD